jgi:transcriptional regulator with XRE-family HTH domain
MIATWKVKRAEELKLTVSPEKVAEDMGLSVKTLERWMEFLSKDDSKKISALATWFEVKQSDSSEELEQASADSLEAPESISDAAKRFQRISVLLLRQRDGQLSEDETNELAKYADAGNAIFRSRLVTKAEPAVKIDVDISGAKQLFLVVTDGGNGNRCDHADWADPVLRKENGEELKLTELKWREASSTHGQVNVDRNGNGQPIRIGDESYSFGIGTHATSVIAYDLPEGFARFLAIGGLDRSGTDQGGDCGANATVQFHVYTEQPRDIQVDEPDLLAALFGDKGVFAVEDSELEKHLSPEQANVLAKQRETLKSLRESAPKMYPIAHVIAEATPADMKVFIRGNPANQGEIAPRRFLRILSDGQPEAFQEGSGRWELAEAIASADNPLTARVMVNRMWQHHFGRGIVGTPDNFGVLGEKPTHPELLDYLTHRFLESGWSMKTMHREMMLSATYQLSTDADEANQGIDADNQFLWRMNRRRLQIEAWRDSLLAVSGRLDSRLEGPSTNLADHNNNRRTIYAFISRHELNNMLRLFDFPDANITASTRTETTVPQQQLFVLNSPFMIEQSKAFAKRLVDEAGEDIEARIRYAFELAYGRPVNELEMLLAKQYLAGEDDEAERDRNSLTRWERYAQVLLGSNEFMYLD